MKYEEIDFLLGMIRVISFGGMGVLGMGSTYLVAIAAASRAEQYISQLLSDDSNVIHETTRIDCYVGKYVIPIDPVLPDVVVCSRRQGSVHSCGSGLQATGIV
ncbi:predicted protein [Sclerotinia sclerotiorum 1980 UF-70]|uniref:Uncharacterized protein n=1 Tax=Sclerotinia sclerotiorum (strain ATCC 18683 / 1980 / Ss-1) TaxID=665079 RepID=A7ERD6_SCLS1|nr:predicted protein [Sclerotinia sclerotiorum 1980 UF-70]EDN92028.1 predicted protein [Sclerotinia sclerotiorum 1980 UF-70]